MASFQSSCQRPEINPRSLKKKIPLGLFIYYHITQDKPVKLELPTKLGVKLHSGSFKTVLVIYIFFKH